MSGGAAREDFAEVRIEGAFGTLTGLLRRGRGPAVVLVHGVMADAQAWLPVARALDSDRRVLVVNRRGRAPSSPVGPEYGLDAEVADLRGWLDAEEQPGHLVGHSYGGLIATEAVRRGAAARSLVLYEPVARPFGVAVLPALTAALDRDDLDAAVEIINVDLSGYGQEHVQTLRRTDAWPTLCRLAIPTAAELGAIDDFPLERADYSALRLPVSIIAGALSRHRPPYGPGVDRFCAALTVPDVQELPGQDHLAHVTAPAVLAATIERTIVRGRPDRDRRPRTQP